MSVDSGRRLTSFGSYLKSQRKSRGMSLQQAVSAIKRQAPELRLSVSALSRYESGEVADPRPPLLHAFAKVYRVPYKQMISMLVSDKYRVDLRPLPDTTAAAESPPAYGGVAQVAAALQRLTDDGCEAVRVLAEALARSERFRR